MILITNTSFKHLFTQKFYRRRWRKIKLFDNPRRKPKPAIQHFLSNNISFGKHILQKRFPNWFHFNWFSDVIADQRSFFCLCGKIITVTGPELKNKIDAKMWIDMISELCQVLNDNANHHSTDYFRAFDLIFSK